MKKRNQTVKGLRTPLLFVFIHGFLNGRFKTAGVDQDTKFLNGAYINGKIYLFYEFCKKRVAKLVAELASIRTEANALIMEFRALPPVPAEVKQFDRPTYVPPRTAQEAEEGRSGARNTAQAAALAKRADEEREKNIARRREIIQRLVEIRNRIAVRERICCEELGAVAQALKDRFCVYGHGVLMQPVRTAHIPPIEYTDHLVDYYADCAPLKINIAAILDEEESK